jgi:hypothetical protein
MSCAVKFVLVIRMGVAEWVGGWGWVGVRVVRGLRFKTNLVFPFVFVCVVAWVLGPIEFKCHRLCGC